MSPDKLFPSHREELHSSTLSDAVIESRGYFTATDPEDLRRLGFSKKQSALVPAIVMPSYDAVGRLRTCQAKPDSPRLRNNKPIKYETPANIGLHLDAHPSESMREMIADPSIPLWITEGIKKVDALYQIGLCSTGLFGVFGFRKKNKFGGKVVIPDFSSIPLNGRTVYIIFDNDIMFKPEVMMAMRWLSTILEGEGARVIPVVPSIDGFEGKLGADDFIAEYQRRTFSVGIKDALVACGMPDMLRPSRPEIMYAGKHGAEIFEEALMAVIDANNPPSVFIRGGELVRIIVDDANPPAIETLSTGGLRNHLTKCAQWQNFIKKDGEFVPHNVAHCPPEIVEHFFNERQWPGIPHIAGITSHPILTQSGQISAEPGYCEESKYYIVGSAPPRWPGSPESAVDFLINDVLVDFCFKDDASIAHALALMLLPVVRPAIDGATPLHVIDAPIMNSGKSKLAEALLLVTQPEVEGQGAPKTEEEWTKSLVTSLRYLPSYVFFDDLGGKLESNELNGVLTSKRWSGRLLGTNDKMKVPITAAWIVTSNNIKLSPDLSERSIWIRLDTGLPDPGRRTDFKHPDLKWIRRENAKILSAVLCIVEHGANNNFPFTGRKHNKYSEWSSVIGGILESCGVTGFMGNFDQMRISADPISDAVNDFMGRWWNIHRDVPMFASSLVELWDVNEELAGLISTARDKTKAFGRQLSERKDRVFAVPEGEDGTPVYLRLTTPDRTLDGKRVWKLVPMGDRNHLGDTNHFPNHFQNQVPQVVSGVSGVINPSSYASAYAGAAHAHGTRPNLSTETTLTTETTSDPNEIVEHIEI